MGKVLICLSGADKLKLKDGKEVKTGFFLKELTEPLERLLDANYDVEFANPTGEPSAMDPLSDNPMWFGFNLKEFEREKSLIEKMKSEKNFSKPTKFSSINEDKLKNYDGVFIPGGHAPMADLWNNADLGRILLHFHTESKPTASICHGPASFLSIKEVEKGKPWPYKGYHMTCYSNLEEQATELLFLKGHVPFYLESALRDHGAIMEEAPPLMPKVTVDRELVTSQNPSSADPMGKAFVDKLQGKGSTDAPHTVY
eukprot:jgi/Chlat1/8426/Chrsp80S00647